MDDCILSSLSLPPGAKPVLSSASSPQLTDSSSSEPKGQADAPANNNGSGAPQRLSRRGPEAARQRQKAAGDSEDGRRLLGGRSVSRERKQPYEQTIDLTTSAETTDTDSLAEDSSQSLRRGRVLRKRKLSEDVDIPTKHPTEAPAFL